MAKINLKSLLSKNDGAADFLSSILEGLQAAVRIEDLHEQILLGDSVSDLDETPILSDGEIIGWVKGEDKTKLVAGMINLLAEKEAERKKLGNEILMLYREVNLIFNFSEKLAQTIGQNAIASLTLQ